MSSHNKYSSQVVSEYWQYIWERDDAYELDEDATDPTYVLGMFPYTSGTLHMGHVRNYAITDAYARYRRMCGDDVLHPMGWDAFGLPAENAAYERYTDPQSWTNACIEQMREEMKTLGFGYDWSREVTTCEPEYYRWNQQFFREFYEAGLVEYRGAAVNWCPDCETVLADAQVVETPAATDDGEEHGTMEVCWRCETPVGRRELDQWFFTITDYAEELLAGLDDLDGWPESVREIQRNWIGKREGARVTFEIAGRDVGDISESEREKEGDADGIPEAEGEGGDDASDISEDERDSGEHEVDVFTTRLDTICGATYLAVSPGHDLASALAERDGDVAAYVNATRDPRHGDDLGASDTAAGIEASDAAADLGQFSGVETDLRAVHPVTGEHLPVYVAAYVLDDVGTGAVMGVPAHNERDHAFAHEHDLPLRKVVEPVDETPVDVEREPFTGEGMLTDSGSYDGLASSAARERLRSDLDAATADVTYRLRDWLISRQRYWGTPIPVVHCEECGPVLVPEDDLPVELPAFVQTTGNPLEESESFVETECPDCGCDAERETDTMDTFVDSSWYFLRYLSPDAEDVPFDRDRANEWLPVDVYVGGEEHAVLHLLYIRFFTRALADVGRLDVREPVERLINQGTVLHSGEKMSKTKDNVISPHEYGAETTRLFVLSAAHPEQDFEWTARDVSSSYDLQQQLYDLVRSFADEAARQERELDTREERRPHDEYLAHEIDRTIAAATDHYEGFRFHRVVSEIRGLLGLLGQYRAFDASHQDVYVRGLRVLTRLVAPLTPYLGEELWNLLRGDGIAAHADWPEPESAVDRYDTERRVVETLRADVRDIFEVAGITDAEEIEVAVAPAWKYRAHRIAREADDREALVGTIMADAELRDVGETASTYAKELQNRRDQLRPELDGDEELALLERAAWLLEDEFDTDVRVRRASDDELARKAKPGKPAIHIS